MYPLHLIPTFDIQVYYIFQNKKQTSELNFTLQWNDEQQRRQQQKIDMKQEKRSEKHGIKRKMCKRIKAYFGRERGKRRKRGGLKKIKTRVFS